MHRVTSAHMSHDIEDVDDGKADDIAQQYLVRYFRPEGLDILLKTTKFSAAELKLLYRGFKQTCPTGTVTRQEFQEMFSWLFPYGNIGAYAEFVFNTFDVDRNGLINFDEFVRGLSVISRGSPEQKVDWVFRLYDVDQESVLRRAGLERVIAAVYSLLGPHSKPAYSQATIEQHATQIWAKMDENQDGMITKEEFMHTCLKDDNIRNSLQLFNTIL